MTKLLADENVPIEAVKALKRKGVDIVSVTEFSSSGIPSPLELVTR